MPPKLISHVVSHRWSIRDATVTYALWNRINVAFLRRASLPALGGRVLLTHRFTIHFRDGISMYLSDCLPCNGAAILSLKGVGVRAIVCHARARNIYLRNVPEHFPSGSSVPLKSITTAPAESKEAFLWDSSRAARDKNLRSRSRVFRASCASVFEHHSKCSPHRKKLENWSLTKSSDFTNST